MGIGSSGVANYANTRLALAIRTIALGNMGDFEVVSDDGVGLGLNFQTMTALDPRITFSRASNATVVGSDGLLQYAPHNLLTYSENFDNAVWVKTTATLTANAVTSPDGTTTADTLTATGADSAIRQQNISATAGQSYVFSIYLRADTPTTLSIFIVDGGGGAGNTQQIVNVTTNWQRFTVTRTLSTGTTVISAQIGGANSFSTGESVYIWGAQLNQGALQPYYSTTVKNLLGYSQNFENAAWTKSNSSIAASTVIGPFGFAGGQKLVESTNNVLHYVAQTQSTSANSVLTLSIYAKAGERTQVDVRVGGIGWATSPVCVVNLITGAIVSGSGATVVPVGGGWFRISLTATADGTTQSRGIVVAPAVAGSSIYTGDGTSGIYIFGAQLSDSASLDPYSYNPVAAPTSTAYYGPRFDYDPATLAPKGLLIEEQRTNLLTYSSELENTAWIKLNTTVSANTTTAPDGTSAADTLIATTINADHVIDESFSAIAGTTYTMSGYVKAAGLTSIGLRFTNASLWPLGGSPQVSFNLVTKTMTVISGQPSAYTITEVNNGWFRIAVSATCAVSGIAGARFQLVSGLSNVFLGDGSSGSYIWGAQLEAGAFPTSYIPTTSATVTRAADNASMVGSNFSSWYNQSEGTVSSGYDVILNTGNRVIFDIGANGAFGTTAYNVQTSSSVELLPNIAPVNMTSTVNTTSLVNKIATGLQNNNSIISVNGALGGLDSSCTMPSNATTLTIGCSQFNGAPNNYLNGHIQSIKYYPTRLPNGTLQGLTA